MTPEQQRALRGLVIGMSAYYGQTYPDDAIRLYVSDLVDLPYDDVVRAMGEVRRDPKTTRMPLPAVIRDRLQPADTLESNARESASRIATAVSRIGPYRTAEAKAYIGELGWEVVKRQGGWEETCAALTYDNATTLQAQWRELAISLGRRARIGLLDTPPSLPKPSGGSPSGQLRSFAGLLSHLKPEDPK
jgi:hypothetical protein